MKVVLTEIIKRHGTLTMAKVVTTFGEKKRTAIMVAHVGDVYGVGDEITPRGYFFETSVLARSRYETLKETLVRHGTITKEERDELLTTMGRIQNSLEIGGLNERRKSIVARYRACSCTTVFGNGSD